MKGTEKQIKYATDLVNEMKERVEKFEAKGKGERVSNEKAFLNSVTDITDAGNVIEIIQNFTSAMNGIAKGHTTLEKMLNA